MAKAVSNRPGSRRGKLEIGPSHGAQAALRTDRRPASRTHAAHPLSHALRELSDRGIAEHDGVRPA
jgi:hypothetical protein